jgi:hypothetical protein
MPTSCSLLLILACSCCSSHCGCCSKGVEGEGVDNGNVGDGDALRQDKEDITAGLNIDATAAEEPAPSARPDGEEEMETEEPAKGRLRGRRDARSAKCHGTK